MRRFSYALALVGLMATGCVLEEDFEPVDRCVPGQAQCRGDGRANTCNEDGNWEALPAESFFCPSANCMVMENSPVCM